MTVPTPLPDPLTRRTILYGGDAAPEDLKRYAALYREAGRLTDSLEFYFQAQDAEGLADIQREAVRSGDAFLAARWEQLTGQAIPPERWAELAENALVAGWVLFARTAFKKAGQEERAESLAQPAGGGPATA